MVQNWLMRWCDPNRKAKAIKNIFHRLVSRYMAQKRVSLVVEDLINQGFISLDAFYIRMNLAGNMARSNSERHQQSANCFALASDSLSYGTDIPGRHFISAMMWLAIFVSRSCVYWQLTVQRWNILQILGEPDETKLNGLLKRNISIEIGSREALLTGDEP